MSAEGLKETTDDTTYTILSLQKIRKALAFFPLPTPTEVSPVPEKDSTAVPKLLVPLSSKDQQM